MAQEIALDAAAIAEAAACFCLDERTSRAAIIYLLRNISGNTMTASQLVAASVCYCYDHRTSQAVTAYLLSQILDAAELAATVKQVFGSLDGGVVGGVPQVTPTTQTAIYIADDGTQYQWFAGAWH